MTRVGKIVEFGTNIKTQIIFILVPFFFFLRNFEPKNVHKIYVLS
jgi:hypothetical protein